VPLFNFYLLSCAAESLGVTLISAVVAPSICGKFGELLAQALLFGKASCLVTNHGYDSGHMSLWAIEQTHRERD
jgi:hypothetical protein